MVERNSLSNLIESELLGSNRETRISDIFNKQRSKVSRIPASKDIDSHCMGISPFEDKDGGWNRNTARSMPKLNICSNSRKIVRYNPASAGMTTTIFGG